MGNSECGVRNGSELLSAEDVVHLEDDTGQPNGRQGLAAFGGPDVGVTLGPGLSVALDGVAWEIDEPHLGNSGLRVARDLGLPVRLHGSLGNLDDQQNIEGPRMLSLVTVGAVAQQSDVRLRFLPSMSSTRSSSPRIPASAMRWYSSSVKLRPTSDMPILSVLLGDKSKCRA